MAVNPGPGLIHPGFMPLPPTLLLPPAPIVVPEPVNFEEPPGYDASLRGIATAAALSVASAEWGVGLHTLAEDTIARTQPALQRAKDGKIDSGIGNTIPKHKGGAWKPKSTTSKMMIKKKAREAGLPSEEEVEYEALEWDTVQVAMWMHDLGCLSEVMSRVEKHEIDGKVMDEIVTVRDHLALEELGIQTSQERHNVIRRWLEMKPATTNDPYVHHYARNNYYA